MDEDALRQGLEDLAQRLAAAEDELHAQVAHARASGLSWEAVAAALGVTKQSAHRRFRGAVSAR